MAQDLKSLVSEAITKHSQSQGPGHITACKKLIRQIHETVGEEKLIKLGPAAVHDIFCRMHPDLAKYLTKNEAGIHLREYKLKLGYKYDHDRKDWDKVKA